jgi:hypothetical protein
MAIAFIKRAVLSILIGWYSRCRMILAETNWRLLLHCRPLPRPCCRRERALRLALIGSWWRGGAARDDDVGRDPWPRENDLLCPSWPSAASEWPLGIPGATVPSESRGRCTFLDSGAGIFVYWDTIGHFQSARESSETFRNRIHRVIKVISYLIKCGLDW